MKSIRKECASHIGYRNENNDFHREDGPAIEYPDGNKHWYINGKIHRTDGPAIEYANGNKYYYLDGKNYPYKEWRRIRKMLWML